jgi:hypothetical protein
MHNAGGELPRKSIPRTPVNTLSERASLKDPVCILEHLVPWGTDPLPLAC